MSDGYGLPGVPATNGHGKNAIEKITDGESAVDDGDWFSKAARHLLPHKPGTQLFLATGLGDERLCQRYAADHVRPPAYFFRRLLRGDDGRIWLAAAMDGSEALWWRENLHAQKIYESLRSELRDHP